MLFRSKGRIEEEIEELKQTIEFEDEKDDKESKKKIKGSDDTKVDILMRRIYEYVTSRTAESSKFVIAK